MNGGFKMSYYYNYYIGYISDNKIYPFGPYNGLGNLVPVISRSSSFASDLKSYFNTISNDMVSDNLKKEFETYLEYSTLKYLYLSELPDNSYIKSGYFLISDVEQYERYNDDFDLFYDYKTPEVYCQMMQNQLIFGMPEKETDDEGNEFIPKCAYDYMYYCYPNYHSKEYESFLIREVAEMLNEYTGLPENSKFVVILAEG